MEFVPPVFARRKRNGVCRVEMKRPASKVSRANFRWSQVAGEGLVEAARIEPSSCDAGRSQLTRFQEGKSEVVNVVEFSRGIMNFLRCLLFKKRRLEQEQTERTAKEGPSEDDMRSPFLPISLIRIHLYTICRAWSNLHKSGRSAVRTIECRS